MKVSGRKLPSKTMENIPIKVKSPSANIEDLMLKCDRDESIIQIKRKISESFPTKPAPSTQKLVYSGKILKDSDHLRDVLRFEDECTTFTFHLVCSIPQKQKEETAIRDGIRHRNNASSSATSTSAVNNDTSMTSNTNNGNSNLMMEDMMRSFSAQYSQALASMPASPSQEEIAAMQEVYNQYLALYMQHLQPQMSMQHHQQPPTVLQPPQQEEGAGVPGAGDPPAAAAGPDAAMGMNPAAAGQIQQDAGDRNRDILDWLYVMTRVLLLFSVIYFHSSFLRLAFVAGLGFLVYLYQNRRQDGAVRRAQRVPVAAPAEQHREEEEAEISEDAAEDTDNEEQQVVEEVSPSKLAVFLTFCKTLVTSLIPEQPQVV